MEKYLKALIFAEDQPEVVDYLLDAGGHQYLRKLVEAYPVEQEELKALELRLKPEAEA